VIGARRFIGASPYSSIAPSCAYQFGSAVPPDCLSALNRSARRLRDWQLPLQKGANLHSFLVCAREGTKSNNILIAMPFYQLHLMFIGAAVVLVSGSIAVALAGRRWPPL
jgi:hypothetical protein